MQTQLQVAAFTNAPLIAFVLAVAIYDLVYHRIPNTLTVPAAVAGVISLALLDGVTGAINGVLGLLVGLAMFMPFYLARGFSAGDVKALGAVGAFLGPQGVLMAGAWTLMAGALLGVAVLVGRGGLRALQHLARRWQVNAGVYIATGQMGDVAAPADEVARSKFPYGIAIAIGTAASMIWS